jgi:uncharacterized RDD family membrane protein YckC
MDLVDPAYAGRRVIAALVDLVPLLALVVEGLVVDPPLRWYLLGGALLWWAASWVGTAGTGQGPGAKLAGTRVVNARTGRAPGAAAALVRSVARLVLVICTLGIAGLSYRWDPSGRESAWWDRIAGTRVVTAAPLPSQVGWAEPAAVQRWTPAPAPAPAGPGSSPSGPPPGSREDQLASRGSSRRHPSLQSQNRRLDPRSPAEPASEAPTVVVAPTVFASSAPPPVPTSHASSGRPVRSPVITAIPPSTATPSRPGPGPVIAAPISSVPSAPAGPKHATPTADTTHHRTTAIRSGPLTLTWDTGRSIKVNGHVLVGRDPLGEGGEQVDQTLAVDVDARGVSKTHLAIDVTPLGVTVTDRHSTNGVKVQHPDGARVQIDVGTPTPVREGDRIEFGGRWLTIGA